MTLFEPDASAEELLEGDSSAVLHRGVLSPDAADACFLRLYNEVPWEQRTVKVFGREVEQPRLVAWFGDADKPYRYSGLLLQPIPWTETLLELRSICEGLAGAAFNSVLANLYRDGQDSVSWHSDDEPELGLRPVIASLSLGEPRRFDLRHRETGETVNVELPPGSVLVMSGATQQDWKHQIPKSARVHGTRINLTFRRIQDDGP